MTKLERIILRSFPISFLIRSSRKWIVPGFNGHPFYNVVDRFLKQIKKIGLYERAAAISFNLIMALPAAVLFLFSLIPLFPQPKSFRKELLGLFSDITPNTKTYDFVFDIITDLIDNQHIGVFSFGFLLLIFYSSNAMIGIIRTFDKSIKEHSGVFLHRRIKAIRLTFILMIMVLITAAALLLGKEQLVFLLSKDVFHASKATKAFWWGSAWGWIRWAIVVTLLFYGIAVIYKFGPSVNKRWKLLTPGSITATILTMATTVLFSYWVNNFASYNRVYGSIGTVLIIMLLVYFNSLILLIGFEINVSITYLTREREQQLAAKE